MRHDDRHGRVFDPARPRSRDANSEISLSNNHRRDMGVLSGRGNRGDIDRIRFVVTSTGDYDDDVVKIDIY